MRKRTPCFVTFAWNTKQNYRQSTTKIQHTFQLAFETGKGSQMFQGTRTRSSILGCKSQMAEFRFFFDINLAYRMYSITDNLSKALQRETISSIEGQETVMKTVETFKSMRNIDSADCFFKTVKQKAANHNFINEPILPRKRKSPNYKSLNDFFIVEGQSLKAQPYFPSSLKEHYQAVFLEVLDLIINSIQNRFDRQQHPLETLTYQH